MNWWLTFLSGGQLRYLPNPCMTSHSLSGGGTSTISYAPLYYRSFHGTPGFPFNRKASDAIISNVMDWQIVHSQTYHDGVETCHPNLDWVSSEDSHPAPTYKPWLSRPTDLTCLQSSDTMEFRGRFEPGIPDQELTFISIYFLYWT